MKFGPRLDPVHQQSPVYAKDHSPRHAEDKNNFSIEGGTKKVLVGLKHPTIDLCIDQIGHATSLEASGLQRVRPGAQRGWQRRKPDGLGARWAEERMSETYSLVALGH